MSYTLLLIPVPAGASGDDVEKIVLSTQAEDTRVPGPPDPEKERHKRMLVDALLAECPELQGGEPDYAELARAEDISEEQARHEFHWWTVRGARTLCISGLRSPERASRSARRAGTKS